MKSVCFGLGLLSVGLLSEQAVALCSNNCNGHGECNVNIECECHDQYWGADCAHLKCPEGPAWFGDVTATDTARTSMVTCSNKGFCEIGKGVCDCEDGFTGAACDRMECPSNCNNRGKCINMKDLARDYEYGKYTYETQWDAERIYGCACAAGYSGPDCSLLDCPVGDDPMTTDQVDEVQLIKCTSTGGTLQLSYDQKYTSDLAYDISASDLQVAISSAISEVEVSFSSGSTLCTSDGSNVASITFLQLFGNLESVRAFTDLADGTSFQLGDGGAVIDSAVSVDGTKESALCSNRGVCDTSTGVCTCDTDFYSSDGRGGPGSRGDCGWKRHEPTTCPNPEEVVCAGHGTCDTSDYTCDCYDGWDYAHDCSQRTCPFGKSWFSYPSANERAHMTYSECSDRGFCDRISGDCECLDGWTGGACQQLECNGLHTTGTRCQAHGECVSMGEMARRTKINGEYAGFTYGETAGTANTWDFDMMFGCLCGDYYDNYECGIRTCHTGDDPNTDGVDEIQAMRCTASSGTFTLQFRTQVTTAIAFDASAGAVETALEALSTIDTIEISYSSGSSFCDSVTPNYITIQFHTENGDVPAIIPDDSNTDGTITIATDGDTLGSITTVAGTTDDVPCSNHGECNEKTGVCECFFGWGFDDGDGGKGHRESCGYRQPIMGRVGGAAAKLDCNDRANKDEPECIERLEKAFAARLERG